MKTNFLISGKLQDVFDSWFIMAELDLKILELLYGEASERVDEGNLMDADKV
ncbi:MAG: hypothetical protein K9H16_06515 [Bacteroidales bacterium]|nr:hypothetical protein [Bacteroidales bacterium]